MKPLALLPLFALPWPVTARAQDLSGSYVFQTSQRQVTLQLEHSGTQVSGVMTGVDGSSSELSGAFDGQKATGTIMTGGATGWFALGFLEGRLTLLVAEIDPTTGEPDLDAGWRMDFTRIEEPGQQPAGSAAAGSGHDAAVTGDEGAASAATPLVQEWLAHLRGKKVTYMDSYAAGGSGGYSNRWEAFLCSDGRFHFRSRSSVGVDVGGVWGGGSDADSFSGTWRIIEQGGRAILQYQRSELAGTDEGQYVVLEYRNGETYFDGERVYVTADNEMCR